MALKIKQSSTFWWPVSVMIPIDGGRHDKQTFEVEFARLTVSEADKLVREIVSGERNEFEGFGEMVKGWKGVVDDGEEVPFSASALKQVLEIPTIATSIIQSYKEATSELARRKN